MDERSYRWVQVVNTATVHGQTIQLIGTTSAEDKEGSLDELLLRHRVQIQQDLPGFTDSDIDSRWVTFMNAKGEMSYKFI